MTKHNVVLPYFKNIRSFWPALVLVSGLLVFSCTGNNRIIEDRLFGCLADCAADEGIDLDRELRKAEKYLVEQKMLRSGSPESYIELFRQIRKTNGEIHVNDLDQNIHPYFYRQLRLLIQTPCMTSTCRIDSKKLKESKSFKMYNAFRNIEDPTPAVVTDTILAILDTEDFKSPFFKTMAIMTVLRLNQEDEAGLKVRLPPKNDSNDHRARLKVQLTEKDVLIVDSTVTAIDQLGRRALEFIERNNGHGIIHLWTHRGTSYKQYLQIYDTLKQAFITVQENYARQKFGMPLSELKPSDKEQVMEKYPVRISEAEPDDSGK